MTVTLSKDYQITNIKDYKQYLDNKGIEFRKAYENGLITEVELDTTITNRWLAEERALALKPGFIINIRNEYEYKWFEVK